MKLDHATIVTDSLEAARRILCSIVGLSVGPRPAFGANGHWLYAEGKPVIHLIERAAAAPSRQPASTRIDHVGLRISIQEWSALLQRMQRCGLPYELSDVPLTGERQLFFSLAPGVVIELVTDSPTSAS